MNKSASSTLNAAHFIKSHPCAGFLHFLGGGVITHTQEHLHTPIFFSVR